MSNGAKTWNSPVNGEADTDPHTEISSTPFSPAKLVVTEWIIHKKIRQPEFSIAQVKALPAREAFVLEKSRNVRPYSYTEKKTEKFNSTISRFV